MPESGTLNRAQRRAKQGSNGHARFLSISDFDHDRLMTVELEGWGSIQYEMPDLVAELALGRVPNVFRSALARALGLEQGEGEELTEEQQRDYLLMQCNIIARGFRQPNLVEELGGLDEAAQWVLDTLPPPHRMQVWLLTLTHNVSAEVFASTFRRRGAGSAPAQDGGTSGKAAE